MMTPAQNDAADALDRAIYRASMSGIGSDWIVRLSYDDACEIRSALDDMAGALEDLQPNPSPSANPKITA